MNDKGAMFRELHKGPGAFIIPNPWDVGTARILAHLGFKALATTSAGMAFALGKRDGEVTEAEMLAHCRMIVEATPLPVSADLEKGFGDSPEEAARTIRLASETGLAGASLEDYSGNSDAPIFDFSLAVERIAAAVEARNTLKADFVLTARCENFLHNRPDLDDTIKRLQAFEKVGADVLYAPGLRDLASIETVCKFVGRPVNVVMGLPGTTFSVSQLSEAGVKRISVGSALARLAFGTFVRAAREMQNEGTFGFSDQAMGFGELQAFFPETGAN